MKLNMQQLTLRFSALCGGQNVADVIGAAFNVMMSALNTVPDKKVLAATAATMRDMVAQLDTMAGTERH
jgi:hypothetical protein